MTNAHRPPRHHPPLLPPLPLATTARNASRNRAPALVKSARVNALPHRLPLATIARNASRNQAPALVINANVNVLLPPLHPLPHVRTLATARKFALVIGDLPDARIVTI